jgi:hypothetical protein
LPAGRELRKAEEAVMCTRLAAQLAQRGAPTRGYTTHAAGAIPR